MITPLIYSGVTTKVTLKYSARNISKFHPYYKRFPLPLWLVFNSVKSICIYIPIYLYNTFFPVSIPAIWLELWAVKMYAFWWENGLFGKIGVIFAPPLYPADPRRYGSRDRLCPISRFIIPLF